MPWGRRRSGYVRFDVRESAHRSIEGLYSHGRSVSAQKPQPNHTRLFRFLRVRLHCSVFRFLPPPPPPEPDRPPPSQPPPFEHVDTSVEFNQCQTTCFEDEFLCRDGGPGSFSPALCPYGTQCRQCGPRQQVNSVINEFDGDDSCQYANDNFCQDGRASTPSKKSVFITLATDQITHVCGFLTDR